MNEYQKLIQEIEEAWFDNIGKKKVPVTIHDIEYEATLLTAIPTKLIANSKFPLKTKGEAIKSVFAISVVEDRLLKYFKLNINNDKDCE